MTQTVDMTPQEAQRFLDNLADRIRDATQTILEATEQPFLDGIANNFQEQEGPNGAPWEPRQEVGDGHPLLNDHGDLMQSALSPLVDIDGDAIVFTLDRNAPVGSILGAARHNFGDDPPGFGIPQREFFYVGEEATDKILDAVADEIVKAITP